MEAQFNKNIYYNYFVGNITMKIWGCLHDLKFQKFYLGLVSL